MTGNSTGYGPNISRLYFDGDEGRYELWEIKFFANFVLDGLRRVVEDDGMVCQPLI